MRIYVYILISILRGTVLVRGEENKKQKRAKRGKGKGGEMFKIITEYLKGREKEDVGYIKTKQRRKGKTNRNRR